MVGPIYLENKRQISGEREREREGGRGKEKADNESTGTVSRSLSELGQGTG